MIEAPGLIWFKMRRFLIGRCGGFPFRECSERHVPEGSILGEARREIVSSCLFLIELTTIQLYIFGYKTFGVFCAI